MIVSSRNLALFVAAVTLGLASVAACAADAPAAIPVKSFFRDPDIGSAKLSPSGQWLAMTTSAGRDGRVLLAVVNLDGGPIQPKVVASFASVDVRSFEWVNDERLVFNTIDAHEPLNDQRFGPGLVSVRRDGSAMRVLIRSDWTPAVTSSGTAIASTVLDPSHVLMETLRDGSDDVLVGEYRWTETHQLDRITPKRLDTATGHVTPLGFGAPPNITGWIFDRSGLPRVATSERAGQAEVHWRAGPDQPWKSIARFPALRATMAPVALEDDGRLFVVAPSASGYATLRRFDFDSGKPEADALMSTPGFDLYPALRVGRSSGKLVGIDYETDAHGTAWFDPDYKKLQATVDARFPGHINVISCRLCDRKGVMLVWSYSDRDPGTVYLYSFATETWQTIGRARDDIDPALMAQKDFFRTKARDGEDLPVWVTTPRGKVEKPRPAVVLVHGGPWVRGGTWSWDGDAQFLASRGYVVIEPEYRGSAGYGRDHLEKGFKQWGLQMQDDLVDAVQWAAGKGLIDPARVCIAGASYGGYATLMGLVRHPDAYKCGVAWLAVSDVRLMFDDSGISNISDEAQRYSLPTMLGDPIADAALLKDASPVEHAAEIRAPLLMAFGENDRRVPLVHGTRMRDAMRAAGRKPEYVVYDGEGHGFLKVENRVDFWTRVEKFLAANLQP